MTFGIPNSAACAAFEAVLSDSRSQRERRAVYAGQISFEKIADTTAFLTRLTEVPGIGKWTAQYIAMRALGEPDPFPSGDLGLLRSLDLQGTPQLEQRAEAWRPSRAYATMYLWNSR